MKNNQEKELILLQDLGMYFPTKKSKRKYRYGLYKCFCRNEFKARTSDIKNGKIQSCGCLKITHNLTHHRLFSVWNHMVQRCNNPKSKSYVNYGARGISVCKEWLDINNFINDMYPSFVEGLSIDRIDVNGNYEPINCRWVNMNIQAQNTRKLRSTNLSGYRGVSWDKQTKKWRAQIMINYKKVHLGNFDTAQDGALAYDDYVIKNNLEHTRNFS